MSVSSSGMAILPLLALLLPVHPGTTTMQSGKESATATPECANSTPSPASAQGKSVSLAQGAIGGLVTAVRGNIVEIADSYQIDISRVSIGAITRTVHDAREAPRSVEVGMTLQAWVETPTDATALLEPVMVDVQPISQIKIEGLLQAVNASDRTVTLLNKVVQITDSTSFPYSGGSIDTLKVGQAARVAIRNTQNGPTAVEVFAFTGSPSPRFPHRIVAAVTSMHGYLLDVSGGYQLDCSRAKVESAADHRPLDLSSIAVGTTIEAWVATPPVPSDPLLCSDIHVQPRDEGQAGGILQAVDRTHGTITVLNQVIQIDAQTSFPSAEASSIDQLRPGCYVHVVFRVDDRILTAIQVVHTAQLMLRSQNSSPARGFGMRIDEPTFEVTHHGVLFAPSEIQRSPSEPVHGF